jgi:iron complex transport system substrate-binding protein
MRVVSLLPSATEILFAIGAGHMLVGRSRECDHPPHLLGNPQIPVLTSQRTAFTTSADTHHQVTTLFAQAPQGTGSTSLYHLDADALRALKPDLILTQDLCEVCSIDLKAVEQVARTLDPVPQILSLNPQTLDAVFDDHLRIGKAVGMEAQASAAVTHLHSRFTRAEEFVNPYADGSVVGFMEWTDPIFIAGHWTVQLIERAGGSHPLNPTVPIPGSGAAVGPQQASRKAGKSIRVAPEVFCATQPHWLVIAPCGLNLDQVRQEVRTLRAQEWFNTLPAVRSGRVALVDGSQYFNRPGPRLVDAFEFLVGWLQGRPELIPEGFAWEPLSPE